MATLYYGGSQYFDENTGTYTNGYVPNKGSTASTVSATPAVPAAIPSVANKDIKIATPDLIQFNSDNVPIEYMTDLLFEDIGGQEIISISRNDIINGQRVSYNPIKNVAQLGARFSPLNMFSEINGTASQFKNFSILFDQKVPEIGSNETENEVVNLVYIDDTNGNLVINVINMEPDEQVEIQVLTTGDPLGDIIY